MQSIEGQLQTCYEYAKQNGHTVVGEYIDRAQSGTTDSRIEFQRMISDSDKHTFEGVLVYQLDRFARNRYDRAINKAKLKKNIELFLLQRREKSLRHRIIMWPPGARKRLDNLVNTQLSSIADPYLIWF